jgi:Tfp pilus assembly protein PilX
METRLAANYKERTIAFEMAEAGLVMNENLIEGVAQRKQLVADTILTQDTVTVPPLEDLDDFEVDRNANGTRKAFVNNMRLNFKGVVAIRRGSPLEAAGYDRTEFCLAYFETVATGTNLKTDPESPQKQKGVMEYRLRSGFQQLVPMPPGGGGC